jgi:hypothetical protein
VVNYPGGTDTLRTGHRSIIQSWSGGCQVTTIQKLLGHQQLISTLIYVRLHNRTVAEDYYAAMKVVEKRLEVVPPDADDTADPPVNDNERAHLLELATQLAEPELGVEVRLGLVGQICEVLNHRTLPEEKQPIQQENGRRPRAPP